MKKPAVYVTNLGGHDFAEAESFGKLVPITEGNINPLQVDRVLLQIKNALKCSTADDFLLISGHGVTIFIASIVLYEKHGRVKTLIWNNKTRKYATRILSKSQLLYV